MGKATIIEAQNSNTQYEDGKSKGVLGKLKGIFADYKHGTRNSDRLYTEELWDNRVFGSEDVMEALETRTLFGELDHPEGDRNETLAQNAAITITKLEKRPEEGVIYGEAEILDTPTGRIVKALADSGAKLGISSRGLGEEVYMEGKNIIDPNTYDFITFDVVVTPANRKARVSLAESKQFDELSKTITDEINRSKTVNQLNQIKTVVESVPTSNKQSLLKLIESKDDMLTNKRINRTNLSEVNKSIALKLINDKYESVKLELDEAKKQSNDSINETKSLMEQKEYLSASKTNLKRKLKQSILECRNKDIQIKSLESKSSNALNENEKLNESISGLNDKITELYARLDVEVEKNERLMESNKQSTQKVTDLSNELNQLKEQYESQLRQKDITIKQLTESNKLNHNKLEESKTAKQDEINTLKSHIDELEQKCNRLTESNNRYEKLSFDPLGSASLLNESVNISDTISDEDKNLYNMLINMYNN